MPRIGDAAPEFQGIESDSRERSMLAGKLVVGRKRILREHLIRSLRFPKGRKEAPRKPLDIGINSKVYHD
jgi:hypothetical protein